MMDLSGYRPFTIEGIIPEGWGALGGPLELICACQVKHQGYPDGRPGSEGALALAAWIMAHKDLVAKPRVGSHPLNSGTLIERIMAGEVLPSEEFAIAIAAMTEGAVLPEMFGRPEADPTSSACNTPRADEKTPEAATDKPTPEAAPASSEPIEALPPLGALGGPLPSGRLFHPIADARFPQGFVLTGCGMALCLDESTAKAMQAAIAVGLEHIRHIRAAGLAVAA